VVNCSLPELAAQVNAWCSQHRVAPASGQAAEELSTRTLRYYRTVGLLDAPFSGGGRGYGRRHFLQVVAVRVLQAQGLPLNRIQSLLFGRPDEELETIADHATSLAESAVAAPAMPAFLQPESWQVIPITQDFLLVSRRASLVPAATLERIRAVLNGADSTPTPHPSHEPPSPTRHA
jgi:DNA-binding transcriptional MerR regulator